MNIVPFFVILAFLATLAVLVAGGVSFVHGGKFDSVHAEGLMEGRVIMQAITFGLIVMAILVWS